MSVNFSFSATGPKVRVAGVFDGKQMFRWFKAERFQAVGFTPLALSSRGIYSASCMRLESVFLRGRPKLCVGGAAVCCPIFLRRHRSAGCAPHAPFAARGRLQLTFIRRSAGRLKCSGQQQVCPSQKQAAPAGDQALSHERIARENSCTGPVVPRRGVADQRQGIALERNPQGSAEQYYAVPTEENVLLPRPAAAGGRCGLGHSERQADSNRSFTEMTGNMHLFTAIGMRPWRPVTTRTSTLCRLRCCSQRRSFTLRNTRKSNWRLQQQWHVAIFIQKQGARRGVE